MGGIEDESTDDSRIWSEGVECLCYHLMEQSHVVIFRHQRRYRLRSVVSSVASAGRVRVWRSAEGLCLREVSWRLVLSLELTKHRCSSASDFGRSLSMWSGSDSWKSALLSRMLIKNEDAAIMMRLRILPDPPAKGNAVVLADTVLGASSINEDVASASGH